MFFHQMYHNMLPDPEKIKLYEATQNAFYFSETKHRGMHLTIFDDILNLYFA